jgi:hypothetical protein
VLVLVAVTLGYVAWQMARPPAPHTRLEVAEAFARALTHADWERGSELLVPAMRTPMWQEIFLGTGRRLEDLGVRVGECGAWPTGQVVDCALDGGVRYQGVVQMPLRRTARGWRVGSFLELGAPPPPGSVQRVGSLAGGSGWGILAVLASLAAVLILAANPRGAVGSVLAVSACAAVAVLAGPAAAWGAPGTFLRRAGLAGLGRVGSAVLLGLLALRLERNFEDLGDPVRRRGSFFAYSVLWVAFALGGLAAMDFPRAQGSPFTPAVLLFGGLLLLLLEAGLSGRRARDGRGPTEGSGPASPPAVSG